MNAAPYAYTYVHVDGRRDWRMAVSRRLPQPGWTETALFDHSAHDDLVKALQGALALINKHADLLAGDDHPANINSIVDNGSAALAKAGA